MKFNLICRLFETSNRTVDCS